MKNVREIDLSSLYEDWDRMQQSGVVSLQQRNSNFKLISDICHWSTFTIGALIEKPQFQQFIREVNGTKFDLILYEPLSYSSLLGIREIIGNPPVVAIITLHPVVSADEPMGNPFTPSYIPSVFSGNTDRMNIWERLENACKEVYCRYVLYNCIFPAQQQFLTRIFGNIKRSVQDLEFDKSLLIASVDFATGYPRPLQPNTIYVGPLHLKKPTPLPQDIQTWMDEAQDGVIYFSMGSNMKGTSLPERVRSAFIKAFQNFPKMRVIWKWEADTKLPGQPDNVLVEKWLPQISVLAHPKLKVFISQCGLQSVQEAIDNAVPLLCIPMFGDQEYNAGRLGYTGVGIVIEFNEINYERIYEKLVNLLTNSSYKENMIRLSSIAKDKPMSAMETAIWWVEYVIRHEGASHLKPASLELHWYQYFMLDIVFIVVIFVSTILYLIYYIIKILTNIFDSPNLDENVKLKES